MPRAPLLLLWACVGAACASRGGVRATTPEAGWLTSSPGGVLHVHVRLADLGGTAGYPPGARLYYQAAHGGGDGQTVVMPWSPLGITRQDQAFVDGLRFISDGTRDIAEDYTLPRGKRSHISNRGVERVLALAGSQGGRVDVHLRVFDDGFAFRYHFPGSDPARFTVTSETSGFRFAAGARAFMAPYQPDYEALWRGDLPAGTPAPTDAGWTFPALVYAGRHFLLVTESGLDGSYCGTHLAQNADASIYRIRFPLPGEAQGRFDVNPSSSLPWTTPWRVVIVGDRAGALVESSLVTDLAAPSVVADPSFIVPGRVSWSWWSDGSAAKSFGRLVPFVDLAAEMGWEYSLVDAGWTDLAGGTWQDLARLAARKKVGLLLWYNSGGPHNQVNAPPRDRMHLPDVRGAEMRALAAAGVRGLKVDFFNSDKQDVIKLYLAIAADAAAHKLVVDFHGATTSRGWERTYPNILSMEAVRGAEGYKFDPAYAANAPWHNTVQVFTRNVVGPMDYTPVTFSHNKHRRLTTWGHELALSVVFESGLQHFADSVDTYRSLPAVVRTFLHDVPAAWDETRLLDGFPGSFVVIARRKDRTWYVGGINGTATTKDLTVAMDFLGNGIHDMLLLADDGKQPDTFFPTRRQRNGIDTQSVALPPYGGFVMRVAPLY